MDERHTRGSAGCVQESFKGNLRIRIYRYLTHAGTVSHLVEVVAWNSWASQGKIVLATGGFDRDFAEALFLAFAANFRRYDWESDEILLENEQ